MAKPAPAPAPKADNSKLTHFQDIERLFRLGMLRDEDIASFRAKGLLPPLPGAEGIEDLNTVVLTPVEAKA